MYNPKTSDEWRGHIRAAVLRVWQLRPAKTGPVAVSVDFFLPRPKRLMRKKDPDGQIWAPVKPDVDNLEKCVLDELTSAKVVGDDCQVCSTEMRTFYHKKTGRPGALIKLWELEEIGESDLYGRT